MSWNCPIAPFISGFFSSGPRGDLKVRNREVYFYLTPKAEECGSCSVIVCYRSPLVNDPACSNRYQCRLFKARQRKMMVIENLLNGASRLSGHSVLWITSFSCLRSYFASLNIVSFPGGILPPCSALCYWKPSHMTSSQKRELHIPARSTFHPRNQEPRGDLRHPALPA